MKLATGILILGMGLGTAAAQNPSIIDNTKAKLNAVQQQKTADSNAALAASSGQSAKAPTSSATKPAAASAKPIPGKPTANNMATAPATAQAKAANKSTSQAVSKPSAAPASQKSASAAGKQAVVTVSPFTAPKAAASKTTAAKSKKKTTAVVVKKPAPAKSTVAVEDKKNPDAKKDEHKTISMAGGRRDPFLSPVVNHSMGGSGCSTGKRCLAVDQIALQGIVKSEAGMIAVVVNAMNKAYFLRENDPVFNGYVVKITGDSIVFKETMQDKLGKSFTREVTKKISTPVV
jgi:membrane protein involved in colicin uptake